jgi:hypothetical protein
MMGLSEENTNEEEIKEEIMILIVMEDITTVISNK